MPRIHVLITVFLLLSGSMTLTSCATTIGLDNPPPGEYQDSYIGGKVSIPWMQLLVQQPSSPATQPGILVEVPMRWQHSSMASVFTDTTGITGTLIITDLNTFEPPSRGPVITDNGYKAIVIYTADTNPTTDFDFSVALQPGTTYPSCFVLKAVRVDVLPDAPGSKPSFTILADEPDPDFPRITDPQHVTDPLNCAVPPPVVELSSFSGTTEDETVQLTWTVAGEHDNAGFNIYRASDPSGPYRKINDSLIPAQGSPVLGANYQFGDRPGAGVFFYMLENVSRADVATVHGTIGITVGFSTYLPLVAR